MSKADQVCFLMNKNTMIPQEDEVSMVIEQGKLHVLGIKGRMWEAVVTPPNLPKLLVQKQSQKAKAQFDSADCEVEDHILHLLPSHVTDRLDEDMISKITEINRLFSTNMHKNVSEPVDFNCDIQEPPEVVHEQEETGDCDHASDISQPATVENQETSAAKQTGLSESNLENILEGLMQTDRSRKKAKWKHHNTSSICKILTSTASEINSLFTRQELLMIVQILNLMLDQRRNMTKTELVNMISVAHADQSTLIKTATAKSLRLIIKDMLTRTFPKVALNAIVATEKFNVSARQWVSESCFGEATIGDERYDYTFFSHPEYYPSLQRHVVYIPDTHHQFVNLRCFLMKNGIPARSIKRNAWVKVARNASVNKCGLSVAMVDDIIDRQSNDIAQITFSLEVETEMRKNEDIKEAELVKIVREW